MFVDQSAENIYSMYLLGHHPIRLLFLRHLLEGHGLNAYINMHLVLAPSTAEMFAILLNNCKTDPPFSE